MWRPGQIIGDYVLLARLREGGMATLFLAHPRGDATRHVAIKVIHPSLAGDEQFRQMFIDEARLSSCIEHPNVVRVRELGQHDGAFFLTMEFVHGCSLSQLQRELTARGRRLAPAFAARIAMQVAEALHAAHETEDESGRPLSVVHRDVTPENILLAYDGDVKLIDFGIAKAYGRKHHTQDGLLKGKFRYMAPEQARGEPVDRRVDVYQLGIVLWEMLTLRRLFDAERDMDLLAAVQKPHVLPPSLLVDDIPPALDAAVMAALEPLARKRPVNAQAFARMLESAVPSVLDVERAALRSLLLSIMHEQRQQERAAYPVDVYERLEQRGDTRPAAGASSRPVLQPTLARDRDHGSDPHDLHDRPTHAGERARGRARPPRAMPAPRRHLVVRWARALPRALARLAAADAGDRRAYWIGLGAAIALAAALALLTVALRGRPRPVPRLPSVAAPESGALKGARQQSDSTTTWEDPAPRIDGGDAPQVDASAPSRSRPRSPPLDRRDTPTSELVVVEGKPLRRSTFEPASRLP